MPDSSVDKSQHFATAVSEDKMVDDSLLHVEFGHHRPQTSFAYFSDVKPSGVLC